MKRKWKSAEDCEEGPVKQSRQTSHQRSNKPPNLKSDKGVDNVIARTDSRLLADYVAQRTKRFEGHLSLVELEKTHIPGKLE